MSTFLAWLQSLWAAFTAGGGQAPAASEPEPVTPATRAAGLAAGAELERAVAALAEQPAAAPAGGGDPAWSWITLCHLASGLTVARAQAYFPSLAAAAIEYGITTPQRLAAWLAQLAHESGGFLYVEEIASGAAYEGRHDLGNTEVGDGRRYKGRGWIELTGRANYRLCGQALGLDLEGDPEQAATPGVAARSAGWYWAGHGCNELADEGSDQSFVEITRKINGGTNGLASREAYWARAKAVLGA